MSHTIEVNRDTIEAVIYAYAQHNDRFLSDAHKQLSQWGYEAGDSWGTFQDELPKLTHYQLLRLLEIFYP
jgi:hypothetical protein